MTDIELKSLCDELFTKIKKLKNINQKYIDDINEINFQIEVNNMQIERLKFQFSQVLKEIKNKSNE